MWLHEDYNTVDFFTVNKDTMQIAYTVLVYANQNSSLNISSICSCHILHI